ncbi:MAG: sulfate transporter [Prevotellaceae bacterium]|nr:sulfate transporter [Prevotellaceae bacterium]
MDNFGYYIACLIVLIIGVFIVKKVVSCMVRAVVGVIAAAIIAYVYFMYIAP